MTLYWQLMTHTSHLCLRKQHLSPVIKSDAVRGENRFHVVEILQVFPGNGIFKYTAVNTMHFICDMDKL